MAVHGLFDFLLEACGHPMGGGGGGGGVAGGGAGSGRGGVGRIGAGGDVPLLLSREPFLNASLKALKVSARKRTCPKPDTFALAWICLAFPCLSFPLLFPFLLHSVSWFYVRGPLLCPSMQYCWS